MKQILNNARQIWREFISNESPELAAVARAVAHQMHGVSSDTLNELYSIATSSCGIAYRFGEYCYDNNIDIYSL